MKKIFKVLLIVLLVIVTAAVALIALLSVTEFKPKDIERAEISGRAEKEVNINDELSIVTWNIGYSALGKNNDFVMDGGNTPPASEKQVLEYYKGIQEFFDNNPASINLFQEVDIKSSRSFYNDLRVKLSKDNGVFALNYKSLFVPFPWPPLALVNSGLYTTTEYEIESANRVSLPCPFSWPLRTANLKRCLLVSYLPIANSDKKLVVINLHLEAYTEDEGRLAQMEILSKFIAEEYAKGNYVIAGGDFNQTFPGSLIKYPNRHKENWNPNELSEEQIDEECSFVYDSSSPSCRLLNGPYNPSNTEQTQYYVIDGYIVTPNIRVKSVKTIDLGFENSDHNPVRLVFELVK